MHQHHQPMLLMPLPHRIGQPAQGRRRQDHGDLRVANLPSHPHRQCASQYTHQCLRPPRSALRFMSTGRHQPRCTQQRRERVDDDGVIVQLKTGEAEHHKTDCKTAAQKHHSLTLGLTQFIPAPPTLPASQHKRGHPRQKSPQENSNKKQFVAGLVGDRAGVEKPAKLAVPEKKPNARHTGLVEDGFLGVGVKLLVQSP